MRTVGTIKTAEEQRSRATVNGQVIGERGLQSWPDARHDIEGDRSGQRGDTDGDFGTPEPDEGTPHAAGEASGQDCAERQAYLRAGRTYPPIHGAV